jgi:UDP-2,3-diacylglucosamine pyrophosphatase LpxH
MKTLKRLGSILMVVLLSTLYVSNAHAQSSGEKAAGIDPFSNGGQERNMIVVISDIHLGADLSYAECNKNRETLAKLLGQILISPNVKELVIAGDLLDEWFVPATVETYQGKDQRDFVTRIAQANKEVFDILNQMIREKKILVTYVPGNHDLTITRENIDAVLPGINQARDAQLGLGTYSPADYPKIAIEHGHRYNFFCAPDPISNQKVAPGTIMPPGYFFTRIAALHVVQKYPPAGDTMKVITPNASGNESQNLLYGYWKTWEWANTYLPIKNKFSEKIILTNVDGFKGSFCVNDLLPYQKNPGGFIDVNLYNGIQDTWDQRQAINKVAVKIPAARAIANASSGPESDDQAVIQYFTNPSSDKRIVVFGHTHDAKIIASKNSKGEKSVYANSGTWIDHNPGLTTTNFVVITPQNSDAASQTLVKLYNFQGEIVTLMAEDSLRY